MNGTLPRRKSPRAEFHDYSGGDYFVTICTKEKLPYFGHINNGAMHLSRVGQCADKALADLERHYPYVKILLWVVMPNHVHAIVRIVNENGLLPAHRSVLGIVIGALKRAVTLFARRHEIEFAWQSRYHDHIIRDVTDGNRIAEYIENNVARWDEDCFYSYPESENSR